MRAAAKIDEFPGGVERDHGLIGFFFDQLAFEDLVGVLVQLQGFVFWQELALVGKILGGKLVHFLFDFFQIFGGEWFVAQEFVEKAVFDRRPDAQFHVRVKLHDSGGQKMRGGMAKNVEGVWIFFCEDLKGDVLVERAAKIEKQAAIFVGIDGIGKDAGLFLCSVAVTGAYLGDQGGVG